jgi:hypothetical protein
MIEKRVMSEDWDVSDSREIKDYLVGYEMSYEDGNRFLMIHLLWSVIIFMVALIV